MLTPAEKSILEEVSFELPALLLDRFKDLVRQSGGEGERTASNYVAEKLKEYGISYEILWPEIYLSTPRKAELKIIGENIDINAKTPSFSISTNDKWVDGELILATSYQQPYAWGELEYKLKFEGDPKGKIVICESVPSPDKVNDIVNNGGVAGIFVQAGEHIHEGICTTVWGNPELDDLKNMVKIPVVTINNPDGKGIIQMIREKKVRAAVRTSLEEGWKACPLVLAKIPGCRELDKFVLLHGHIDSWYTGIGDNALGDATLLEIARVLFENRDKLRRSVWVAWWPGHSTGRFAGSTWFADHYALDVYENCVAQVNCESTGCMNANTYEEIMWTEDVDGFCRELIEEVTGIKPTWTRPTRAGDYSFNNIGVTSFFMLSSNIGKKRMNELGYYQVYGCGGNIEWHTVADDMRLVDEEVFLRDTKLYLAGVLKMANAEILPINSRNMLSFMEKYLREYEMAAGGSFDLMPLFEEIQTLKSLLDEFYLMAERCLGNYQKQAYINDAILKIARKLIRINYTSKQEFKHDSAAMVPPIPDIAPVLRVNQLKPNEQKHLLTQLIRGRNRVQHTMRECGEIISSTILIVNN